MLHTSTFLSALLAVAATTNAAVLQKRDSWGGALSLGPSKSTIISAETTITPGQAPPTQSGELFLWPGMSNGTGDLVQTTLEQWPDNSWCGAKAGQWCVRASVFGSFGQLDGPAGIVDGADQVKIVYTLQSNQQTWVQTVTNAVTGALLTTYSHDSGPYMRGYGTGTECDGGCTPTISPQKYSNTVITLAAADPTFGSTLGLSGGTTYTGLVSSEGGKVWTIAEINIPAMNPQAGSSTSTKAATTSTKASTTSTKASTTTTQASTTNVGAAHYAQCGGSGWTGATTCVSPYVCTISNAYYSQCL